MGDPWQPISTAPRDGTKVLMGEGARLCIAAFERRKLSPTAPEAWVLYLDYGHGLPSIPAPRAALHKFRQRLVIDTVV
jgi:hypothetical protein